MKIKSFILTLSLLGVLSCASSNEASRNTASSSDKSTAKSSATAPSNLSEQDMRLIRELLRIRDQVGNEVWPGFGTFDFKFVLVGRSHQWAINVDPLPPYYRPIEIPASLKGVIKSLAVTEAFRNNIGEKSEAAPAQLFSAWSSAQTGSHFSHSIYFVKTLEEYRRSGVDITPDDWIHISLHELFHTYQDQFIDYSPEFMKAASVPYKGTISNDKDIRKMLGAEFKALSKAACGSNLKQVKSDLKKALAARGKRWKFTARKYSQAPDQWERFEAWVEGTAKYTETGIMTRWAKFANQTELAADPAFQGFQVYKNQTPKEWCGQIADNRGTYWYSMGFAYALILDKLDPSWKSNMKNQPLFFDSYFQKLGVL